ncbi:polysaccharide biosynthesis protein [Sphingobium boeckii]|uniref:FlaA1/EpsC-like NDP-sugar epimerase n=1 Tax=Sphingobium boeckii TaxID=1082345 RepID=A0A7W9AHE8_9SPHN|nr:nucleoside-diphosphate sugar epimerase/dehydratase [Sphingobium boeckii]MBB5685748.1 FlaA1/EpsC-like NDP-sugar epimerase [Sphingobium boeckii]
MDLALCVMSVWLAFSIRVGAWDLFSPAVGLVIAVAIPSWLIAARWCGVHRSIIRYAGGRAMIDLAMACLLLSLPMMTIFMFVGILNVPRTIGVLQPMLFMLLLGLSRIAIRYALVEVLHVAQQKRGSRVAIFGAGKAGQQLGFAIRHDGNESLVCYLDDDVGLEGHRIDGVPIYDARDVGDLIVNLELHEILLALPSVPRWRRLEIVAQLQTHAIKVRSLPSIANIMDGQVSTRDLRDVQVEELLGRDPVPPNEQLLSGAITGKIVMVSGAGGSIGSELCRQIVARHPSRLILVEHSEFGLYSILTELEEHLGKDGLTQIVPELANVSEAAVIARVMERHRPQTVFHAAAYKHVPLVEANPIAGLKNNILGTYHCCLEAERVGASRFILVSTDKAVRPTNVMGASKRVCELILQARAMGKSGTVFSMVRFGNVLGSSGSVVPRFRAQIAAGGPVTLTHRDVTRFFMTIPEAAQLVMQAGAMAKGGEVFVLDMGQSIKIFDLACSMIQLSGCSVRSEANPDGDIAIEEVGLRPGEKMYEELLLGNNPQPTDHSRIMRAQEVRLDWRELSQMLAKLFRALDAGDFDSAMAVVRTLVPDYALHSPSGDAILEQNLRATGS